MPSEVAQTTDSTNIGGLTNDTGDGAARVSSARDDAPADVIDKRASPRKPITRTVHMGTGLGPSLECELKDISQTGGRLGFSEPNCAPQEFLIRLNDGVVRWCQVMWRSKTEVGIRFIKTPKSFATKAMAPNVRPAELNTQSGKSAEDTTDKEHSEGAQPAVKN